MKRILALAIALMCLMALSTVVAYADSDAYIHFKQESYTISAGKTITLAVQQKGKTGTLTYTWESSDESVATVSKGTVKGISEGTVTIHVVGANQRGDQYEATCTVQVVVPVESISVEEKSITLCPFLTHTPVVTISPENATVKDIEWKSSNEKVAKVDEDGTITGYNYGQATVTGKSTDGSNKTVKINVKVDYVTSKDIVIDSPEGAYLYYYFGSGILMINYEGDCFDSDREWEEDNSYHLLPLKEGKGSIIFQFNFRKTVKVNITVKKSALAEE